MVQGPAACVVRLKGLPFKGCVDDVVAFFTAHSLSPERILIKRFSDGRLNGEVSCPSPCKASWAFSAPLGLAAQRSTAVARGSSAPMHLQRFKIAPRTVPDMGGVPAWRAAACMHSDGPWQLSAHPFLPLSCYFPASLCYFPACTHPLFPPLLFSLSLMQPLLPPHAGLCHVQHPRGSTHSDHP